MFKRRGFRKSRRSRLAALVALVLSIGAMAVFAGAAATDLPFGIPFLISSQGSCTAPPPVVANSSPFATLECELGTIPAGGTAVITVGYVPGSPGVVFNSAEVIGREPETNLDNNFAIVSTTVTRPVLDVVDLGVTKVAIPDTVSVGKTLKYIMTVTNHGPAAATGVRVLDKLPNTLDFVDAVSTHGICGLAGNQLDVLCEIGDLPAGGNAVVQITVQPAYPGVFTNTVSVDGSEDDPNPNNNFATVTNKVVAPFIDLMVTKSDHPDPIGVGGVITYTITVTNAGPDDANDVNLFDIIDASQQSSS